MNKKIVAVAGGFDPIHIGHIRHFREAKKLGDELVVMLNSDECMREKKGSHFMPFHERKEIIEAIDCVDRVVPVIDKDRLCVESLEHYKPHIFAKGGDRTPDNMPHQEIDKCKELGIEIIYGIGGDKIQSSSWLTKKWTLLKRN